MKIKKSIGVFFTTLVLTTLLIFAINGTVTATDDETYGGCIGTLLEGGSETYGPLGNAACNQCENDGQPTTVTIGGVKYTKQRRISATYIVTLMVCRSKENSTCKKTFKNPNYQGPSCPDILTLGSGSGTGSGT